MAMTETGGGSGLPDMRASDIVHRAAQALHMTVETESAKAWPMRLSSFQATAQMPSTLETIQGFGTGASVDEANIKAMMECAERYAQFNVKQPPIVTVDSYQVVAGEAIFPEDFGLYSHAQYVAPNFRCAPFSEQVALEWLEVVEVCSGVRRLVPAEFIYPRVELVRQPLVVETSSGTAAHGSEEAATLAAVCEIIERDGVMLFWYRQPPTTTVPLDVIPDLTLRRELLAVQAMGFVVIVCHLHYDLDIPCFLILALKGNSFGYGLGCHPDWSIALRHALAELGRSLLWLRQASTDPVLYQPLPRVRTPIDHYFLYNRGPFHTVLRQVLGRMLQRAQPEKRWMFNASPVSDAQALDQVLESLISCGYRVYTCNITPPLVADCGVWVMRALVPGLIPVHFGHDQLRLGCHRLWASGFPGRLSTLLPHFLN